MGAGIVISSVSCVAATWKTAPVAARPQWPQWPQSAFCGLNISPSVRVGTCWLGPGMQPLCNSAVEAKTKQRGEGGVGGGGWVRDAWVGACSAGGGAHLDREIHVERSEYK